MDRPPIMLLCLLLVLMIRTPELGADPAGREVYRPYGATCHGLDARGGNASTLFDDRWSHGDRPERIRANIANGIMDMGMPAFGATLGTAQLDALMAYIAAVTTRK